MLRLLSAGFGIILGSHILTGCAAAPESADDDGQQVAVVICTDPRPEMCTMDYTPVCGRRGDGTEKTYSNGCSACSDKAVVSYRPGACEQEQ